MLPPPDCIESWTVAPAVDDSAVADEVEFKDEAGDDVFWISSLGKSSLRLLLFTGLLATHLLILCSMKRRMSASRKSA